MATTTKRAPMTFAVEEAPSKKVAPVAAKLETQVEVRKSVATRLPPDLYRQAKARAALDNVTIQEVIETALREFITRGKQ